MELHQLEAFSAVMSAGSVTGAARLLGRSQPGVSRMIQDLEQEIEYPLFDRKGPRVTPTERAFLLYAEVERMLVSLERIRASALAIGRNEAPPLRIAATPALAAALVPRAIARTGIDAAAHETQLRSASAEQVVQALLSRSVDVGIATLPLDHAALDLHYLIEAPCVAVVSEDDPLADATVISLHDLAARKIATVANRYRLRRRIDAAFDAAGLASTVAFESNASLNAVMAAQAKLAVAVVDPATAFGTPVQGVVVRPVDVNIPFYYGVVTASGKAVTPAIDALITAIDLVSQELLPGVVRHQAAQHDALLSSPARHDAANSKRAIRKTTGATT
ncbi:LysR family transcriptional regulator [Paraburkholderia caribensis]|jgi:DNA-binding transcriptional LysR family regulator|uniref:LysR family transcriptional regulator n=1 Tax=Paraburkholderia caribensis TaxID=75105 RepID=A0A9Q6S4W5_9BURK|nr:LysR family transcriptional regulator [Paraburkholderia caribensis]MCO4878543.1 LysR family transcriptional regulator [Paraburkholderia caribensis]MDR6382654.1 DNA-binding transcriptional LysR family regulator [Paraburkholderia caribensis]PTB28756.1 LysR family transcriptional regulator [Paraburkholderia caribensis]QLB64581.1 LysR family transcriptional regulator [Paraburkholderia caribensis]